MYHWVNYFDDTSDFVSSDDLEGVEVILGRLLIRSNKLKCLSCNK